MTIATRALSHSQRTIDVVRFVYYQHDDLLKIVECVDICNDVAHPEFIIALQLKMTAPVLVEN